MSATQELALLVLSQAAERPTPIQPLLNALLNGSATVLLVAGLWAIHRGRRELHRRLMIAAFVASALFLVGYLTYHFGPQRELGPTPYRGTGFGKVAYFAMLISHLILAVVNLPMVLRTFWLAHRERWAEHRRWAKITFPIWLYVSVTGVAIYLVLYQFQPAGG